MADQDSKLKVNYASASELQSIIGVGPQVALTIIMVRRMQGNISKEILEALMRSKIPNEVLPMLDFQERWDPPTDQEEGTGAEEEDETTMIKTHGEEEHKVPFEVKVEDLPSIPKDESDPEEVKFKNMIESCVLNALKSQKEDSNPVVKPKRSAIKLPKPLVESSDEDDISPSTPRHKYARSSGRKSRLEAPEDSDEDDIKWRIGKLPGRVASTPHVTKKSKFSLRDLPKTLAYDGKSNWRSFWLKFSQYAESCEWSDENCRMALLHCLTGKALDFGARQLRSNSDMSFKDLVRRLDGRFGEMLPDSAQAMFFSAKQTKGESLEDWADRIQSLATEAFPGLPEKYAAQQTVDRFCQGLLDTEAGHSTFMQKYPCMEMALNDIRLYQYSKSEVSGKSKRHYGGAVNYDDSEPQVYSVQSYSDQQVWIRRLVTSQANLTSSCSYSPTVGQGVVEEAVAAAVTTARSTATLLETAQRRTI